MVELEAKGSPDLKVHFGSKGLAEFYYCSMPN